MTNGNRKWHPEVEHNLSYLGVLTPELLNAGRWDLAAQVRDEYNLTPAKFEEIINVGLELGIDIALPIAKRQRAVRMLLEEEGPSFDGNSVNDILHLVDAHWDDLREERLHRLHEADERRVDSDLSALTAENDPWVALATRLGKFDDLFELHFEAFLRDHEEELKKLSSNELNALILDLPGALQAAFDHQYRKPLEDEFLSVHGEGWKIRRDRDLDLSWLWDVRFELSARTFLMDVYRGKIKPGPQQCVAQVFSRAIR